MYRNKLLELLGQSIATQHKLQRDFELAEEEARRLAQQKETPRRQGEAQGLPAGRLAAEAERERHLCYHISLFLQVNLNDDSSRIIDEITACLISSLILYHRAMTRNISYTNL
jgi:hypothetical protein